jgi:hypothetical protein
MGRGRRRPATAASSARKPGDRVRADAEGGVLRAHQAGADRGGGGEIAAEMLSPYPPGIPVVAPGERITRAIIDYLRIGKSAGMLIPDATDPSLATLRVVA